MKLVKKTQRILAVLMGIAIVVTLVMLIIRDGEDLAAAKKQEQLKMAE